MNNDFNKVRSLTFMKNSSTCKVYYFGHIPQLVVVSLCDNNKTTISNWCFILYNLHKMVNSTPFFVNILFEGIF